MRRSLIGALALALAGCTARSAPPAPAATSGASGTTTTTGGAAAPADFGTLKNVCHTGTPGASPSQGVSATDIKLGVFTDMGFNKSSEFVDAAKVFTAWCNDNGGINGRKLVPVTHDSALMNVDAQMLKACQSDFALVGGGAALDALGVKDRLSCTLPDFPAQVSQIPNVGSDLQVYAQGAEAGYLPYRGYYSWLTKEAYPDSAAAVGIIAADSPVTKAFNDEMKEVVSGTGATVSYSDLYPPIGVSDWTPYAQAIKSKNVKGLIFLGDFPSLTKLEQAVTAIGYKLDWVDANSNAYTPNFPKLAGNVLAAQTNFADLSGVAPVEQAADNPATKQVQDLFAKYDPGVQVTLPVLIAFDAWLLFATSASQCAVLSRTCVLQNAMKQTAWTGGGLTSPRDLSSVSAPLTCFNVMKATPQGWSVADFKPNQGIYRCGDDTAYKLTGNYGKALTLADVGKTMADVK